MTPERLPWPRGEIGPLADALHKWLVRHAAPGPGRHGDAAAEQIRRLQEEGWLWPEDDALPVSRGEWVALLAQTTGQLALPIELPAAIRGAAQGAPEAARDWAALAACGWACGAARWLVDATIDYVGTRQQFGQPIGRFQTVAHRAVDMHADAEACNALLWSVAPNVNASVNPDAIDALVDFCWRATRRIGQAAIQLHGAIAMTDELKVGAQVLHAEALLARHGEPVRRAARRASALLPTPPDT